MRVFINIRNRLIEILIFLDKLNFFDTIVNPFTLKGFMMESSPTKITQVFGVLIFFLYSLPVFAQFHISEDLNAKPVSLYKHAKIANVGQSELTFDSLLNNQESFDFQPLEVPVSNLGFTEDNYWVKFSLLNKSGNQKEYYLETGRPITDRVDLYAVGPNGHIEKMKNGDIIPFKERVFTHRKIIFPIQLDSGVTKDFYIHYNSDGEVINLPLLLYSSTGLVIDSYFDQLVFGVFYGILLLAGTIYLFFYFGIGEKSFLLYSGYVLSVALLHFSLDGYFFQFIAPEAGWYSRHAVLLSAAFSAFAFGRYTQSYLKIKEFSPNLNHAFNVLLIGTGILILSVLIYPSGKTLYYALVNVFGIILLFLIISSVILGYIKGKGPDIFFALGLAFFVVGFFLFILNNFSLIPNSFWSENSSKLGTGMEIIFLSLSMANRIRILKSDKEKIQETALKQAQESNEIKSFFLSNMSHELRTPLNAILGLSRTILQASPEKSIKEDLEVIQYSSMSLLSSINDILDYSKIEKRELILINSHFDFRKLMKELKTGFEKQARDKNLVFVYEEKNPIPDFLIGDLQRLRQIFENILNNAIKFTTTGSVKLSLESSPSKETQIELLLSVTDTGVGIRKEKLDRIFDSFIQEQTDDKRKFGGFGLGLCIVKALVELKGGTINIISEYEKGTSVMVNLNFKLPEPNKVQDDFSSSNSGIYELQNKKILVVEDNPVNQLVMRSILKKWKNTGFEMANNGFLGLEKLRQEHFDLILMDLQMPEMDGYEATQAIRNGDCGPEYMEIPIIAVTADATDKAREKVFDVGMDEYITKPVDQDELYTKVKKCLQMHQVNLPEVS